MTTGEIGNRLGVTAGTVRRWANAFSKFLSDGANPPKGEIRRFDEDDFQLLQAVAHYSKNQHLTYDAIHGKLDAGEHLSEEIPTPAELRGETPAEEPVPRAMPAGRADELIEEMQALTSGQQELQKTLSEKIETLNQQLDGVETRLDALNQIDELRVQLDELRKTLPERGIQPAELEQRLQGLQSTLASQAQIEEVKQSFGQLRDTLQQRLDAQDSLRQRLDELQAASASAQQIAELRETVDRLADQSERFEQAASREQLDEVHQSLGQLHGVLQQQLAEGAALQQEISDLQASAASQQQLAELREMVDRLGVLAGGVDGLASRQQVDDLQQALAGLRETVERGAEDRDSLRQRVDELQAATASAEQVADLRGVVDRLGESVGRYQDLASRDQVSEMRQALDQVRDGVEQQLVERATLEQRMNEVQAAGASAQQVAELREVVDRLGGWSERNDKLISDVQQQIGALDSRLASHAQASELQAEARELHQMLDQHAEDERLQLQRTAQVEQQVRQLQLTLEEERARRVISRFRSAFGQGSGRAIVQVITWALALVAALGVLYYLDLTMLPTVLLAVAITLTLWFVGRVAVE